VQALHQDERGVTRRKGETRGGGVAAAADRSRRE